MLAELPAQALDRFVEVAGAFADFPLLTVELRHLGGVLRRAHPEHGALSSIPASYSLFAAGMVPCPDLDAPTRAQVQAVRTVLAPWAAEPMYSNFAESQCDPASFWGEHACSRLCRVKAAVDPDDLVRANHPIIGRG